MTAEPTPVPIVMSVAVFAVARKTFPASRDEDAMLAPPRAGRSQALSTIPPDSCGCFPVSRHAARGASLALLRRSTRAIERPSCVRICPTGFCGAFGLGSDISAASISTSRCYGSRVASGSVARAAR